MQHLTGLEDRAPGLGHHSSSQDTIIKLIAVVVWLHLSPQLRQHEEEEDE